MCKYGAQLDAARRVHMCALPFCTCLNCTVKMRVLWRDPVKLIWIDQPARVIQVNATVGSSFNHDIREVPFVLLVFNIIIVLSASLLGLPLSALCPLPLRRICWINSNISLRLVLVSSQCVFWNDTLCSAFWPAPPRCPPTRHPHPPKMMTTNCLDNSMYNLDN